MRDLVGLCSAFAICAVVPREAVDYQHTSVCPGVVGAIPALSPVDSGTTLAAPGGVTAAGWGKGGGEGFGVDSIWSDVFYRNGD